VDPPGTIGELTLGAGVKVKALVLVAAFVNIGIAVKNPWNGKVEAAEIWRELAYVEICRKCSGSSSPALILGGERLLVELASAPDNDGDPGAITSATYWNRLATGIALAPVG
jgi:hypothetical protein